MNANLLKSSLSKKCAAKSKIDGGPREDTGDSRVRRKQTLPTQTRRTVNRRRHNEQTRRTILITPAAFCCNIIVKIFTLY